jgi:hypothetical protein
MQTLLISLGPEGALVEISVGLNVPLVRQWRQARRVIPQSVTGRALLDIGADCSCLDPQLLAPFQGAGLQPEGFQPVNIPALGGLHYRAEYYVCLTIVHPSGLPKGNLVLGNQLVIEESLGVLGYQALIGRDVLERCLLVYDGPGKNVTLAY